MHLCLVSLGQTFDVLFLLSASEKVDYVFWVGHTVHKLLTEAGHVECLKPSTIVHLEKVKNTISLI